MKLNFDENEIDYIINYIKNEYQIKYDRDPINYFLSGGCYLFALIIGELIPDTIIMDNGDHTVVKINNIVYDVRGKITNNEVEEQKYIETKDGGFVYLELALYPSGGEKKEADEIKNYLTLKGKILVTEMNKGVQKTKA